MFRVVSATFRLLLLMRSFTLSVTLVLCLSAPGFGDAPAKVTYVDHVLPIFRNTCLNCHNPDKKKAGLDLTTYAGTIAGSENGKVINPGNAEGSLLYKCVLQNEDPKMPPKGDKLTDAELVVVKNWIAGFALESATSKPAAASQNQVAAAVVSLERPPGPPPMPGDLPLEPVVRTRAVNSLTALAASPWAPLVAVGGQKQVVLYNTETLQPVGILPFPEGFPTIVRFSRNGQLLLTGGGLGGKSGKVVLWNVLTGQRAGSVGDEVDQVLAADVSPDHGHVALGGPARVLKIFATKDGKLLHSLKKHTDWVTAVAFSPDGRYLASADRNGGIVVWEGASGKEFNTLPGHKAMVTALAFMPGVLASGGEDGKITLWDVKEAKEIRSWTGHAGGVASVDFTPDGRLVSAGRDKIAKVWDQEGKAKTTSEALGDIAMRAVLSSDRVIAGDWTGKISVFGADGKRVGELTSNPPPIADQLAAAQQRLTEAEAAIAPLQAALSAAEQKAQAEKAEPPAATAAAEPTKAAELTKKLEQLTAEVAKRREARAAKTADTPEFEQANAAVQATKAEIASVEAALAAAKNVAAAPVPAPAKPSPSAEEVTKAKAALDAASVKVAAAKTDVGRWTRAQSFMVVHRASTSFSEKKERLEELIATARDALQPAEQANAQIETLTKASSEAPAKIQAAEAALAKVTQERDAANKTLADAQAAVVAQEKAAVDPKKIEAEIVELTKKIETQTAELAKLREVRGTKTAGTPEYAEADAKVQGAKPEIAKIESALAAAKTQLAAKATPGPSPELLAAQELVKKTQLDVKLAADKVAPAEKALAKIKADSAAAVQQLADLKKKVPEIAKAAEATKVQAERDADLLAKELEKAKSEAERARAEYDAKWPPAQKSADAAVVAPAKS